MFFNSLQSETISSFNQFPMQKQQPSISPDLNADASGRIQTLLFFSARKPQCGRIISINKIWWSGKEDGGGRN